MLSYTDKFYALAVEKAKLKREAWLAMINSRQLLTTSTTNCHNNKKISETSFKIFIFASLFAGLP